MQIKGAKEWGYHPTSFILGKNPKKGPKKWDLILAEAYQILDSERCSQCGQPRYVCQSDDPDIDFRLFDETCNAMRKKARYEDRKKDDKGREGIVVGIEAYTHSGEPAEVYREDYYKEQLKARDLRETEREKARQRSGSRLPPTKRTQGGK